MDNEIVHWRDRQVKLQRLPIGSIIERHVNAAFCTGIEQPFALAVFSDGMYVGVGSDAVDDAGPSFAEVGGLERIGSEVIHSVPFHCDICRARLERRRLDHADCAPLRQTFRSNVRPVFAIAGNVHQTIVRPCPDQVFLQRRFHHRKDGVVDLDAGVVLGNRAACRLLFILVVASQVRADDLPVHPLVGGFEQHLRGKVQGIGIMR